MNRREFLGIVLPMCLACLLTGFAIGVWAVRASLPSHVSYNNCSEDQTAVIRCTND